MTQALCLWKSFLVFALSSFACAQDRCSVDEVHPEAVREAQHFQSLALRQTNEAVRIDAEVYFHIITRNDSAPGYPVTDEQISAQFALLQASYQPHDIHFTFAGVDTTIDNYQARPDAIYSSNASFTGGIRRGGYDALNIYFYTDSTIVGNCGFPQTYETGSRNASDLLWAIDGCHVHAGTMPYGTLNQTRYGVGDTAIHESGHWFGLIHTFTGSCGIFGNDGIDDTPAQNAATVGCPVGLDSCPDLPGLDPIHNFMDYSYDSCYEEFTPGQAVVMRANFEGKRKGR